MNPSVIPDVDESHERRLKENSEDHQRTGASEKTLPDQVADRTKRQVEKPDVPRSSEK